MLPPWYTIADERAHRDIVDALISISHKTDVVNKKTDRDIRSKGPCQPETIGSSYLLRT